jgi:hypothetical protein
MTLLQAFEDQAGHCIALGSPFMGQLMNVLARDWPAESAVGRKFATVAGDVGPMGASLPLRIAGGLHALVLNRKAPALAAVYPPNTPTDAALSEAVLEALTTHEKFLLDWVDSAPQTNDVRRSAALIAGARVAVQHFDMPIHLSELGASGGLNLMWDHFALEIDGNRFGPNMSTILLSPDWTGALPPSVQPRIEKRHGVDLNPLDPTRHDHLLRLMAFLWPDQPERLHLTRSAASVLDAKVHKGDAIDWLARHLPEAPQDRLHLIQHTVAWQYFPAETQARGKALIEAAGKRATQRRPLAWLSMENDGAGKKGAALVLRLWPGDITLDLGRADFHGRWIDWQYSA